MLACTCVNITCVKTSGTRSVTWPSWFHTWSRFPAASICRAIHFLRFNWFICWPERLYGGDKQVTADTNPHLCWDNLLFLQYFHGEVVSCYAWLDSICSICLAQIIRWELHANRNIWDKLQQFDDWWDKYLRECQGLNGVSGLSVKLQSRDQRGGTYWAELRLCFGLRFEPPLGSLNTRPSHSMA